MKKKNQEDLTERERKFLVKNSETVSNYEKNYLKLKTIPEEEKNDQKSKKL